MLAVQKLYHSHVTTMSTNGLARFKEALTAVGVDQRDYPEHEMMLLDYDMIECDKNHPVVLECRGLLMGYDGTIIRKGFNRFFNLGENGVDTFDFANSLTFEKADGSLCFIYWCEPTKQWEIGTRGTAFAEGPHEWHGTFRGAMLKAMGKTEAEFQRDCSGFDKDVTRLYEYTSPDNRIVTPYTTSELVALSYVSNIDGSEIVAPGAIIEMKLGWNVRPIKMFSFNTQEDCLKALGELTGLQEGYVVYNTLTKGRVKIKNAVYLAAHRLRGNGLTMNAICELVVMGEYSEYCAVFPEDAGKFIPAIEKLADMMVDINTNYTKYKHLESQKDFALAVKDLPLSAVLFKARKNDGNAIHEFNLFPVSKRAEWLKEKLIANKGDI